MEIKQKKGISLIVLVITIIVMIILAAAIILSLNSSGIIGKANQATTESNTANKKEAASIALAEYELKKQLGELTAGETATSYVQKALDDQGIDASDVAVDEKGNVIVGSGASAINKEVAIGAYVDYIPTEKTSTTYKVYDASTFKESENVYFATQTGENALRWRYMGVDENGNALLVADRATTDYLYLQGSAGYLQGPRKMTTLCKELYSSEKGTARSMTVEDVNRVLEANPVGQYDNSDGELVDNTARLTIGEIVSQKGESSLVFTTTPDGTTDINTYVVDYYSFAGTKYKANTTDEYKLIFQNASGGNIRYLIASSCVGANFYRGDAMFEVRYVDGGRVSAYGLFGSLGGDNYFFCGLRPVITLNSDVQFGTQTNDVWSLN